MASTEDRVVRMVFDNAAFEKKINATLASLGQLDKALKFTGGTKGLSDVSAAAEKVNFNTVSQGIENVSKGFIALATIAITTLSRITDKIITVGTQLVKSFTLDPILEGFREYETNMTSIQTILANTASKGTTLDQVTEALDRLNQYSDQTIYNFAQMARNIGTFTAAGVDLETSVNSIKGIANLAAMSGSTSEQAATAMYQLSQAIATGSVKLMDWNSVVNAGMGGEAFQNALFETGKAMGTLLNVPVDMTFQQWKDAGNSFRESLQDGWITAEVLTTTLEGFTGDMTEEMLLAKGFTEEQAANILKMAAVAKAAATEVKTFSQLMTTVKESIATGWADTFKIIIGNFNEAKKLWTDVSNAIGGFVQGTSNARNELLQGWKDMGGRTALIEGLKTAFSALGEVLNTIKDAFRYIFPATTSEQLMDMTNAFVRFAESLKPSASTLLKLDSIFSGFFSVLSIGWTVLKEGVGFFIDIGKAIASAFGPGATDGLAKVGDALTRLKLYLVDGGKIADFFDTLATAVKAPIPYIEAFIGAIKDIFSGFKSEDGEVVASTIDRISARFENLKGLFEGASEFLEPLKDAFSGILDALEKVWDAIASWFNELGQRMADALNDGDWNALFDALNTALLGGIAALLAKFIKDGFSFDIGGGMFEKIGQSFEQLTGVLSAMQANIKASALLKIAAAIAILTASVLVLSLIDSAALSKALAAMAVGFGQLLGAFSAFTKIITDPKTAATFTITATGLVVLAGAMLLLSFAVRSLAKLDWEELGRGLTGIVGLLGAVTVASKPLAANSKGMISAGIGLIGLAVALAILSIPMKVFASMKWEELAKGLVGVAGALGIITVAMRAMPTGPKVLAVGVGLIAVGVALNLIAASVAIFATMEWESIGKGMAGIGGSLLIIAGALNLMPVTTPIIAAGLVAVGIALNEIAVATKLFGTMSWEEIGRGLAAMAGSLLLLSGALFLMGQTGMGSVALIAAAVGLGLLSAVIMVFARTSWEDLVHGLGAIGVTLLAFAVAAMALQPAVGAMLALGVALIALGAGMALIGGGVWALAKGLQAIVGLGGKLLTTLSDVLEAFAQALPTIMKAAAEGIVEMLDVFIKAAPAMAKAIGVLIGLILDTIIKNLPKVYLLIRELLEYTIALIREYGPQLIDTGLFLLIQFLKGIRDNIEQIVKLVADILVNFLQEFQNQIPRVARELANTIIKMWLTAAYEIGRVSVTLLVGVGQSFIQGMWDGMKQQLDGPVFSFVLSIPGQILGWIGDVLSTLWQKGVDFLTGLYNGLVAGAEAVWGFFGGLPDAILGFFGDAINWLLSKGRDILSGLWNGLKEIWVSVANWVWGLAQLFVDNIPNPLEILLEVGKDIMRGIKNGMEWIWDHVVKPWLNKLPDMIPEPFRTILKVLSPSRVMMGLGENIMMGLHIGMEDQWKTTAKWLETVNPSEIVEENLFTNMSKIISDVADKMSDISEFAPTITPVLDLTQVQRDASKIGGYISQNDLVASLSYGQATIISRSNQGSDDTTPTPTSVPERSGINFEQNIYAPTRLSTSDIYKQTRNQITIAKEELKIP